ncbi:ras-related protein Rab-15 [Aplysia californica]|uniref:Ras-related protein Rab-15 n=1 Tax=Aplysia californica TaxID=6500 RepID=A0ABM1A6B9_APLCA|nr:ras-related protein Rab-15 [Aplysia californica]XP_005105035.1 ras-related protein Rab-15 [Aplysia californica]XP_012941666.1 ras-related protein Rab-15 [Aplysia californica]
MAKRYDDLVRLLLVGDAGVGKTCMICQYANREFHHSHITTLGVDFKMKVINLDGKRVKLQIWDTAGQERFESITKQFYTRAQGCILVYDICDRKSFDSIAKWIVYIKEYARQRKSVILVGNKSDLEAKRVVSREMGQSLADFYKIPFYESSAKDPESLELPFKDVCRGILRAEPENNVADDSLAENVLHAASQTEDVKLSRGCPC